MSNNCISQMIIKRSQFPRPRGPCEAAEDDDDGADRDDYDGDHDHGDDGSDWK